MAQKTDNIHKRRKSTIRKGYIFMLAVLLLMIGFLVRLVTIQNTNVKEIEDKYINKNYRVDTQKLSEETSMPPMALSSPPQ